MTAVGTNRNTYRVLVGNSEERDSLEELGVNRGIMFKVYLKEEE
jgi:hypothetical protein